MGLDGVELMMDVEDHFGISIRNAEATGLRTVGDLVLLIQGRIEATRSKRCYSLRAFLELRRCAREINGDEQLRIRPRDLIVDRLSPSERRRLWKKLSLMLASVPRDLQRPRWMSAMLLAIFFGGSAFIVKTWLIIDVATMFLFLFSLILVQFVLLLVTRRFQTIPPIEWRTFGEITRRLVGVLAATKHQDLRTYEEVFEELRPIIVAVLGVDASEVVPAARFVEDLGVG